ncbi:MULTISPECIES: PepSY domain-containing protein [unclassified Halomonas]|uniref:PepSY domain-containing protein n=1 Tax=unclassified Halomonas TaxID=2609666 RepID=UPI0021E3FFE9|nr:MULTISPECIES: PepSY domain-containing protein [unclassified Halomonas]UYF99665.1 PepSY domain-containing protein [Halomonas sp. GD1P12]WNL39243.1 PepSY domain-containing protein [Halomonas sp. PAMB 3232]
MKKTAIAIAITAAATLGLGQAAMADQNDYQEALDQAAFADMIQQAESAGVASFRELQIDEERGTMEFEVEGWDADGQAFELTLNGESGEVMHESSTATQVAPWGLDAQQLNSVLDRASQDGFDRFEDIDLDEDGSVDVSGFDGDQREMERSYGLDEFKGGQ